MRTNPIEGVRDRSVSELVAGLHHSRRVNAVARSELVSRGKVVAPQLAEELGRLAQGSVSADEMEQLARLIRVLRELEAPDGVETCCDILLAAALPDPQRVRGALMTEALLYLSESFESVRARETYVSFVLEHRNRYVRRGYFKQHWGAQGYADHLQVDIVCGIPSLVKVDEERARGVLRHLVRNMHTSAYLTHAVCYLDEDGYEAVSQRLNSPYLGGALSLGGGQ